MLHQQHFFEKITKKCRKKKSLSQLRGLKKEHYCPLPKPKALKQGLENGKYLYTELGLEMRCTKCKQYWPADTEFFYVDNASGSGLMRICIGCAEDYRQHRHFDLAQFDFMLSTYDEKYA